MKKKYFWIFGILALIIVIIIFTFCFNKKADDQEKFMGGYRTNTKIEYNSDGSIKSIAVNDDIIFSLRNIIPKINKCNVYLYKQYNGYVYNYSYETYNDSIDDYNDCKDAYKVYSFNYLVENKDEYIYLYDYVLLFNGKKYGNMVSNMKISKSKIVFDDGIPSDDSIKKYGGKYVYIFKLENGSYNYVRTKYIK